MILGQDNEAVRRRELALIHVAKQQLGMEDDAYRAVLWAIGRVSSAADLDWSGRKQLLDHLKKCGFRPRHTRSTSAEDDQVKKIRALWLDLHAGGVVRDPSEAALTKWVKRMTGVDSLRWLRPEQKVLIIESLKKWNDRPRP